MGKLYNAAQFLQVESYRHVLRWAHEIFERPAVARGRRVNRVWGAEEDQVRSAIRPRISIAEVSGRHLL